ncbi:MAG: methyl-accepting chemotaxis protein, partial [Gammaproteobacteria bacterium]|nr:methyl-accepting chemotaxis protein [Gammaproteobacteria bacterium]
MFRNIKISTRLMVANAIMVILVIGLIIPFSNQQVESLMKQAESRELEGLFNIAQGELKAKGELAKAMATIVAATPEIQAEFANGDRDALANRLVPLFGDLKSEYAVRQFQFHTPPATSFLRVHKPQKFGDDLSSFRKTVVETNKTLQPISGLEKGVAGLGIRGLVPVMQGDAHTGSVEFGLSFGQPFFDDFKAQHAVELALYIPDDTGSFKAFGSTFGDGFSINPRELNNALQGEAIGLRAEVNELPHKLYLQSIKDFSGNPVGVLVLAKDRTFYADQIAGIRNFSLLIGFVALLAALGLTSLISMGISRPIRQAAMAMADIAQGEGDLTRRLDASGSDEISHLADAFNQFAEKVRQTVSNVAGVTVHLGASAEEMAAITQEAADSVSQQREQTEQVATAMNEMTATIQEVARNAAEAAGSATTALDQTERGQGVVQSTIHSISGLASEIERAAGVINDLEAQSLNIGSVLDVIRGIAEQTNLLALNAAIEAARAGEQGRGFAVVADEVRTLASRTQESTEEIQGMIESLQAGSQQAVKVMQESNVQAQTTVEQASEAGGALSDISSSVTTINDMNMQIANAAEEQGLVSEEVNRNVIRMNDEQGRVSESSVQISRAGEDLAQLAAQL